MKQVRSVRVALLLVLMLLPMLLALPGCFIGWGGHHDHDGDHHDDQHEGGGHDEGHHDR